MNIESIISITCIIGIIQSLIFASLILLKKKKNTSDGLLLAWFLVFSLNLGLIAMIYISPNRLSLALAKTLALLHGPFLFLYAKSLFLKKLSLRDLIHALPFLLLSLFAFLIETKGVQLFEILLVVAKTVALLAYPIYTYSWLNNRQTSLKNYKADDFISRSNWIKSLLMLMIVYALLGIFHVLADLFLAFDFSISVDIILFVSMITLIGYYGLKFKVVYEGEAEKATLTPSQKYQTSSLKREDILDIRKKIDQYFETSEDYLEHTFSLTKLSSKLQIPKHHLSQVMNLEMGTTFYDLVNAKRVQHAIHLITKKEYQHLSLESIGYECGFNSKSVFFHHFKRLTGKTPGKFKQELSTD